jgi:hypothetical protein
LRVNFTRNVLFFWSTINYCVYLSNSFLLSHKLRRTVRRMEEWVWFKQGPSIAYKELSKMTIFLLLLFANKTKTSTWNKWKQKHRFVYKLYGFCCCAYQNNQKKKSSFFLLCLGFGLKLASCSPGKQNTGID